MAKRLIVKLGEDILRKKCREVTEFDDRLASLLDDMKETMTDADGVGLAGPQVGVLKRVAVISPNGKSSTSSSTRLLCVLPAARYAAKAV